MLKLDCKLMIGKRVQRRNVEMMMTETIGAVHTDSLIEFEIDVSRDRRCLLFCVMQN